MAIDAARALLARGGDRTTLDIPLGPEIGQCCGGRTCSRSRGSTPTAGSASHATAAAERRALPEVYVFGAGHVGRALAAALALLPVRPVLVDQRADELRLAPTGIDSLLTPLPEEAVRSAAPGGAFVVLTHDHALDFLIVREALARGDAAYVGMIGSQHQARVLRALARRPRRGRARRHRRARLPDRRRRPARQAPRSDRRLRGGRDHAAPSILGSARTPRSATGTCPMTEHDRAAGRQGLSSTATSSCQRARHQRAHRSDRRDHHLPDDGLHHLRQPADPRHHRHGPERGLRRHLPRGGARARRSWASTPTGRSRWRRAWGSTPSSPSRVVGAIGYTWQQALGAVFISGCIFLILTVTGVRRWLVAGIPHSMRSAVAAGIGMFLGIIALKNAGIVVASEATYVDARPHDAARRRCSPCSASS